MKKLLASIMALCIVGGAMPAAYHSSLASVITASAEDGDEVVDGVLTYYVYEDHAEVVKCDESAAGEIIIPDKINGVPVTFIHLSAFDSCASITSVTIPNSVTSICQRAFSNCTNLASITIPDSVTSIDSGLFDNCKSLTSVTIPESVTSIGIGAFENCRSLTSITIPESVTSIGRSAFKNTAWLEAKQKENPAVFVNNILIDSTACSGDITIPDSVTVIGDSAFKDCRKITSVVIPDSVKSIGNSAFDNCTSLRSVSIPNSVTSIGDFAFEECVNLRSIKIPDSVTSIGSSAFSHCTSLESANIPDSVKTIKQDTFAKCESLESIIIPSSVTSIDRYAFANCLSLTSITIPESVKSIDEAAFSNCTHLTSVTILNSSCEIFDDSLTICSGENYEEYKFIPFYNGTIFGYADSTAQEYAEKYGYKFEPISEDITSGTSQPTTSSTVTSAPDTTVTSVQTTSYKGYEEFYVDIVSDCPTISHCFTGLYGDVVLPEKQDGVVIEKLGDNAFWKCRDISAITVPENYKYIGRDAFDYKGLLRSITFLNPDIVFDENKNSVDPDVTIYGYRNSTAQAYAEKYGCKFRALEDPFLKGDANLDDKVNISDAVLVMQVATNPDKYGKFRTKSSITSKGEELADVDGTPGLTNSDALLIQKYKLGLVSSL